MALDPLCRPLRSELVRWDTEDERGILVNEDSGYYFGLNPVGLFVWQLCDGVHSVRSILDGIVENFDVDDSTAIRDLESFMGQLEAEGLLEIPDAEAS